jgi:hypothetical protein
LGYLIKAKFLPFIVFLIYNCTPTAKLFYTKGLLAVYTKTNIVIAM